MRKIYSKLISILALFLIIGNSAKAQSAVDPTTAGIRYSTNDVTYLYQITDSRSTETDKKDFYWALGEHNGYNAIQVTNEVLSGNEANKQYFYFKQGSDNLHFKMYTADGQNIDYVDGQTGSGWNDVKVGNLITTKYMQYGTANSGEFQLISTTYSNEYGITAPNGDLLNTRGAGNTDYTNMSWVINTYGNNNTSDNGSRFKFIEGPVLEPIKYRINWDDENVMVGGTLKVVYANNEDNEVLNFDSLVPEGTELKIIPSEKPGYTLTSLSYSINGGASASFTIGDEPYTFVVEGGTESDMGYFANIHAEFTPRTYTLTTSVNPAEGGSVSVTTTGGTPIQGSVTHGQTIVVSASSANDRYELQSLEVEGATKVADQENQYTVEGNVTVTATFTLKDEPVYRVYWTNDPVKGSLKVVYADSENNVVENSQTDVPVGTRLRVIPLPEDGYAIKSLSCKLGSAQASDLTEPYEFNLTADARLEAVFEQKTPSTPVLKWSVGGTIDGYGWGTTTITAGDQNVRVKEEIDNGELKVPVGTEVSIQTSILQGGIDNGVVATLRIDNEIVPLDQNGAYSFTMEKDVEVSVEYAPKTYSVEFNKTGEGTVVLGYNSGTTGMTTIKANTEFEIVATPETGWQLKSVTVTIGGETATPVNGKYTATGDVKVDVVFEIRHYTIEITQPEEGATIYVKVKDATENLEDGAVVEYGTELEISVETETGYNVKYLYVGTSPQDKDEDTGKYYYTAIDENIETLTISVELEPEKYDLEVEDVEGAEIAVKVQGQGSVVRPGVKAVQHGQVLLISIVADNGYIVRSLSVNGTALTAEDGIYTHTVDGNVSITAVVEKDTSSINSVENGTVYYNAAEEVLYTGNAASVRVYDLSGRLVLNADSQETVSLAQLADGVYTAIVDNVVLKLKK